MTNEQWLAELLKIFPPEILGYKRPTAGIATDLEFSTYFPEFIAKDGVGKDKINTILRRSMSNDEALKRLIEVIQNKLASCDLRIVTEALKGLMSPEMLRKLNGIQEGATNYAHPATHAAAMIVLDALHRFVTDAEKAAWNAKANASHGTHIPAPQGANNGIFLRNDNTWQYVTPGNIGAYTKGEIDGTVNAINSAINGKAPTSHGTHVPGGGNTGTFLRGDNTWQALSAMGGIVGGSLAQNGWVKFANGLILQWGRGSGSQGTWIAFPLAFPRECLNVNFKLISAYCRDQNVTGYNTTGASFGWTSGHVSFFWQAIGI